MKKTLALSFFLVSFLSTVAVAQSRQNQTGELSMEQDDTRVESFSERQDKTIVYFTSLKENVVRASTGTVSSITTLDQSQIIYLNAAYLYCTVSAGTCPSILDTLLEIDVINSRLSKTPACPTLKAFWKSWIDSDMETRQSHQVKTGFLTTTDEFKRKQRPRYIVCLETVKKEIAGAESDTDFFKARYGPNSAQVSAIDGAIKILEHIRMKVPNVVTSIGVK